MGATNKKTQVLYGSFWLGLGFKVKGALFISFMRNVANIPYEVEESNLISLPWSNQFLFVACFLYIYTCWHFHMIHWNSLPFFLSVCGSLAVGLLS